jgi:hypothetical protein
MESLPDAIEAATTTLLCAPSMGTERECLDLLSAADDDSTVVWVSYNRPPSVCVEAYRDEYDTDAFGSVIVVGDMPATSTPDSVSVETVSTPDDLTGLGITLSQTLSAHDDVVLCFDSLTVLLQYVDHETAYEFLNAVTGHLYATDATAHFHLDPTAHDTQTTDALASLFDAVAEREDSGWSVRKRKLLQS